MTAVTFAVLVFLLLCQAIYLSLLCFKHWKAKPETLVLIFVLYSCFLWTFLPIIAAVISNSYDAFTFGYGIEVWNLGLWIEVVFFAVFILGWHISEFYRSKSVTNPLSPGIIQFVLIIAVLGAILYFVLDGPWSRTGYETATNYVRNDINTEEFTKGGIQASAYHSIVLPALCLLMFYIPKRLAPKWALFAGWIILALAAVDSIASGTRGAVVNLAFLIGTAVLISGKAIKGFKYFAIGLLAAALLSSTMMSTRQSSEYRNMSISERAMSMLNPAREGPRFGSVAWFATYFLRLASIQDAGILAERTSQNGQYAGIQPFIGSVVGIIPRLLWPGKPIPLSADGTVSGMPWYLCMAYQNEPWNNGSVSTSGVAYWQFGWLGVMCTGLITGMSTRMLGILAFRKGTLGAFLFLVYCAITRFRIPVALDEFILDANQLWLPILGLYFLYRLCVQGMHNPSDQLLNRGRYRVSSGRVVASDTHLDR